MQASFGKMSNLTVPFCHAVLYLRCPILRRNFLADHWLSHIPSPSVSVSSPSGPPYLDAWFAVSHPGLECFLGNCLHSVQRGVSYAGSPPWTQSFLCLSWLPLAYLLYRHCQPVTIRRQKFLRIALDRMVFGVW